MSSIHPLPGRLDGRVRPGGRRPALAPAALPFLVAALALVVVGCGGGESGEGEAGAKVGCAPGNIAPAFSLTSLSGEDLSSERLEGQVVILDFWATWCAPCRMAIPHLRDIQGEFGGRGVTVVAVAMDDRGEGVVRPFVEKNDISYPVALPDDHIARDYCGILSLPTTYVIAPDGTVYRKYIGYRDKAVFERDIYHLKPELRPAAGGEAS